MFQIQKYYFSNKTNQIDLLTLMTCAGNITPS